MANLAYAGGGASRSRRSPAVIRVRGTEQHRDSGAERFSVNRDRNAPPKLTGRANAMTRGKGKKIGLARQASSAASKFSKAQKRTYAAMNRQNSSRIATNVARKQSMGVPTRGARYTLQRPRNAIDQAHESFFDLGRFLRDRTR